MPTSMNQLISNLMQSNDLLIWIRDIASSDKGWPILGYEFGWLLLFWTLLPWRLSKGAGWWGRVFTQVWVGLLYWVGALWFIPASQWGDPYRNLLSFGFKALFKMLLA